MQLLIPLSKNHNIDLINENPKRHSYSLSIHGATGVTTDYKRKEQSIKNLFWSSSLSGRVSMRDQFQRNSTGRGRKLKGHCHAIWQLYKKLEGIFASIEFQN